MTTTTIVHHPSATLAALLDRELAYSPSIQGVYSSHLAMALVALEQLGASASVLQAVFDDTVGRELEPRDDVATLQERRREVVRDGIAATVQERVGALVDAPASALFHPVIRLAYALDIAHEGQVAAAVLDWERRHHALPVGDLGAGSRRLVDVAAELAARPDGTWERSFDLDAIARRPELRHALADVALDEYTLDDVSAFAINAHLAADDFLTLHLVTGARAVRAVSAWLDDATAHQLATHTLAAMAVGYAAVGAPGLLEPAELGAVRAAPVPPVETIEASAAAARDPHVIKLANVALVELARTADPLYRFVAARVVGLAPPASVVAGRVAAG